MTGSLRVVARTLGHGLLFAACAHAAPPPVYLFSLSGSAGPDPVIAVAYSRVTGPPIEVPAEHEAGVAFLRPGAGGLELLGVARRSHELHEALSHHPTYIHGAVGGPRPWVVVADEDWTSPREALLARDLRGNVLPRLAGRQPARIAGGVASLEATTLVATDDDGHERFRRHLETAAPAGCPDDEPTALSPRLAVSPSGGVVAAVRAEVHRGAVCVETVARLTRVAADGTRLGSDAVLRLTPPDELWNTSPDPTLYGASNVHVAQREDGSTLLAVSSTQPAASAATSAIRLVRLVAASPDGTLRVLRTIPGEVRVVATAGSSWILFLEPRDGGTESSLIVLADDGRSLGDLAIPRRQVAIVSLPDGAFVAWRASEHIVCGVPVGEDGRRSRIACRRVVP